jgi:hypothetical protein
MVVMMATFLVTTAIYMVLLAFVLRRVARHCQGNETATRAVTEHVLLPILGRSTEQKAAEQKPAAQKTNGTLV